MKPSVPETGRVIKLDGMNAVVMMEGGKSCKGCGAAKIGLCKAGGSSMFVTARNTAGARFGDHVIIGIDDKTQYVGYLLAYLIPLSSFLVGAIAGSFLGRLLLIPYLDVLSAFCLLATGATLSYIQLRKLDSSRQLEIKKIVSGYEFSEIIMTNEEEIYLKYSHK